MGRQRQYDPAIRLFCGTLQLPPLAIGCRSRGEDLVRCVCGIQVASCESSNGNRDVHFLQGSAFRSVETANLLANEKEKSWRRNDGKVLLHHIQGCLVTVKTNEGPPHLGRGMNCLHRLAERRQVRLSDSGMRYVVSITVVFGRPDETLCWARRHLHAPITNRLAVSHSALMPAAGAIPAQFHLAGGDGQTRRCMQLLGPATGTASQRPKAGVEKLPAWCRVLAGTPPCKRYSFTKGALHYFNIHPHIVGCFY